MSSIISTKSFLFTEDSKVFLCGWVFFSLPSPSSITLMRLRPSFYFLRRSTHSVTFSAPEVARYPPRNLLRHLEIRHDISCFLLIYRAIAMHLHEAKDTERSGKLRKLQWRPSGDRKRHFSIDINIEVGCTSSQIAPCQGHYQPFASINNVALKERRRE